jgi:ribose/xylose/arabinose/galactoside ABC-type transport system permease subunit
MESLVKTGQNPKDKISIMDYISCLSLIALVILFTSINKNFLNAINISNLLTDLAPLLAIGCGVTFVLLIGSIDLSIGAIASCSAVLLTVLLPKVGIMAYLITLIYGMTAGFINGVIYTKVKIPSFIATLGAMSVWQSVAYVLSKGAPLQIKVPEWGYIAWVKIKFGVFSLPLIISLIVLAIFYIVQTKTKLGKHAFAIGANERAARIAGVNTTLIKIGVFSICGLCSALSGIFLAAKLKSGIPTVGEPFTLMAVAAVALGGTSLSGGKGGVIGTILGVALVIVIQNGMNFIAVDALWQQIVFGILIILAVYITTDRKGRNIVIK